ncbi:MAG: DUF6666 family protein [Pirellulaceae bacterium]
MFRTLSNQCIAALFLALSSFGIAEATEDNPLREALTQDDSQRVTFPDNGFVRRASYITLQDTDTESVLNQTEEVDPLRIDDQTTIDPNQTQLEGEIVVVGETIMEGEVVTGDCATGLCGTRLGICADGCLIPCPRIQWERYTFFSGVNAFTGPLNRGGQGSFGFMEGFNYGRDLNYVGQGRLSAQLGMRATQTNLSGSDVTNEDRKQIFLTAGIFRRADWGLQGGAVVDYLHDDWYYDLDLIQVRTEISWQYPDSHELGIWMAFDSDHGRTNSLVGKINPSIVTEDWESTDLYAFFLRKSIPSAGITGRIMGGFTGNKDGLLGIDCSVPVNEKWTIEANAMYLIPEEGSATTGYSEEAWNIGFNFVYYPGCRSTYDVDYNRPLFDVGSNGNFFVDRK